MRFNYNCTSRNDDKFIQKETASDGIQVGGREGPPRTFIQALEGNETVLGDNVCHAVTLADSISLFCVLV